MIMKRVISVLCLLSAALLSSSAVAASIRGRVMGENQEPISYATVVLSLEGRQVAGVASGEDGRFDLVVDDGEYDLMITYVGYVDYNTTVSSGSDLGDITLESDATQIEDVVVTSNFIRREADRFVVDVANAPSSIGQDGEELLKSSPGVWINEDEISINGNSNPKIYVNDRELKMTSEQTMIYLRNLKSEDVRRIEVIPQSGAEFDASSSSGVIMIYLRRQTERGMIGSLSFKGGYNEDMVNYSPSASINFQSQKLTLNSSLWYNRYDVDLQNESSTIYSDLDTVLSESSTTESQDGSYGGRVEAIYSINDRHSVGAEVNYFSKEGAMLSRSNSLIAVGGIEALSDSEYDTDEASDNLSATINYIYKLDSLGSKIKLLADYNKNWSDNFSDNRVSSSGADSLHQSFSVADFQVATATLAIEQVLNPTTMLKGGVKYTRNDMDSRSTYSYYGDDDWLDLSDYNSDELYTENIGAAYIIGSTRMGQWSVVAGLRGEYTQTQGRDNLLNKDYMSWFPNLNVSYLLDPTGSNSITMQYSRSISRPSFWSLNPARTQISEYFYQVGNPSLMPEYKNSVSLTYVYKYKYSLTASMQIAQNSVVQIMVQDDDDPNMTYISNENISNQNSYFLITNLPFQLTKWWSLNANVIYGYRGERIDSASDVQYQHMLFANAQSTFTLPKSIYLTLGYYGMSDVYSGNIHVEGRNFSSVSLSKKFLDNRLSASIKANNIFTKDQVLTNTLTGVEQTLISANGWMKPTLGLSISYNFKAGKEYQQRQGVESASAEDRARLSSGDQQGQ
ncbi:MAG: outer membrane beta-barrel family protein [Rikenellaceae bacterium]